MGNVNTTPTAQNRKLFATFIALFIGFAANAQRLIDLIPPKTQVDMATGMRSNGKIYVVVAVLCIILLGLFFYLFSLDRKISKLEKENN